MSLLSSTINMNQVLDMKLVNEILNEMKLHFEEEKRTIITARQDINAITTLLIKMKELPIIAENYTPDGSASFVAGIQDGQLVKIIKELQNYMIAVEDLTIEINIHDQQLEEKRGRDIEKEVTIMLYNEVHTEVESLTNQLEMEMNILKEKEEEMVQLTNDIKLSTLDVDYIINRLDFRTKLFEDYMKANKISDKAIEKLTAELGRHIEDINKLSNEFICYKSNNNSDQGYIYELLQKIKEKEGFMDQAAEILKKYDQQNTNLQQLFDLIRLNNMSNIFDLLIKNFQKMVLDMDVCRVEIEHSRFEITEIKELIKTNNEQLAVMLKDVIAYMKTKPSSTYPINGSNKDLLEYFNNMYFVKKEDQILKTLEKRIKQKGTEVSEMCRDIINYQKKESEKLRLQISAKNEILKQLQARYALLHREVEDNNKILILQTKLVDLMKQNEHLLIMNKYWKSKDAKLSQEVKVAEGKIRNLQIDNTNLNESNTDLLTSNTELTARVNQMENYVRLVHRSLNQIQYVDHDQDEEIYDSDDSFNRF